MNILENLSKKMELTEKKEIAYAEQQKAIMGVKVEKEAAKDVFAEYEQWKESKRKLAVRFMLADDAGNLSFVDENGIKIILMAEKFRETAQFYSAAVKDSYLKKETIVCIHKIDRENNTVYLKGGIDTRYKTRAVNAAITAELNAGNNPVLRGRAFIVKDEYAIINILDQNVQGILYKGQWSRSYVHSLRDHLAKGDVIEFIVKKAADKKQVERGGAGWILTRKQLTEDPWKNIPIDIKENGVMNVKCIEKPEGKMYWWGISEVVPDIEIMGNYSGRRQITVGSVYECNIRAFSPEKHILKVSPFAELTSGSSGSIRALKEKVKKLKVQSEEPTNGSIRAIEDETNIETEEQLFQDREQDMLIKETT